MRGGDALTKPFQSIIKDALVGTILIQWTNLTEGPKVPF